MAPHLIPSSFGNVVPTDGNGTHMSRELWTFNSIDWFTKFGDVPRSTTAPASAAASAEMLAALQQRNGVWPLLSRPIAVAVSVTDASSWKRCRRETTRSVGPNKQHWIAHLLRRFHQWSSYLPLKSYRRQRRCQSNIETTAATVCWTVLDLCCVSVKIQHNIGDFIVRVTATKM